MKKTTVSRSSLPFYLNVFLLTIMLFPSYSFAGEWRVTPIRIELDKNAKSGVVTIVNEGTEKLNVQMKGYGMDSGRRGKGCLYRDGRPHFFPEDHDYREARGDGYCGRGSRFPRLQKKRPTGFLLKKSLSRENPRGLTSQSRYGSGSRFL